MLHRGAPQMHAAKEVIIRRENSVNYLSKNIITTMASYLSCVSIWDKTDLG